MQVSSANNVKVYNLSSGKSLPEWLSDRKKRALLKTDSDLQKRIELIQDFEMPTVSNCVRVSEDKQHIIATGINCESKFESVIEKKNGEEIKNRHNRQGVYKPRIRCYDVSQLSMKFERGLDSEVVKFHILSEDYSKLVLLQCDRYVEFHSRFGRYHRLRIPRVGRDLAYHTPSCDLFFVGAGSEIYRLNLDQGRFLSPLTTNAIGMNCCAVNPVHHLLAAGTVEGRLECWDPRSKQRVSALDCALKSVTPEMNINKVPSVTAIAFKDALHMAVGTSTGQVLMYDIRSDKPVFIKDHRYQLPIKTITYNPDLDMVISSDKKAMKIWNEHNGKPFVTVEPEFDINDICQVPKTGLILMANEAPKMSVYFIPSLGPAPKWCSFLDNLTEELEENPMAEVYDDYKFLTKDELEMLGLGHLIGTSLLRAYMHGFFMDIRLYHKAKAVANPFAYEEYRKDKIRKKIDEARVNRVKKVKNLPSVNAPLALKLQDEGDENRTKGESLLQDDRFSALFKNPDFQVDEGSEEYKLINPLVSKQQKKREKEITRIQAAEEQEEELEGKGSSEESSSDDDDQTWVEEMRKQRRLLKMEKKKRETEDRISSKVKEGEPKMYEVDDGEEFLSHTPEGIKRRMKKLSKTSLEDRIKKESQSVITKRQMGNKQITFKIKRDIKAQKQIEINRAHNKERKTLRRSAGNLRGKKAFKN